MNMDCFRFINIFEYLIFKNVWIWYKKPNYIVLHNAEKILKLVQFKVRYSANNALLNGQI